MVHAAGAIGRCAVRGARDSRRAPFRVNRQARMVGVFDSIAVHRGVNP
jgi:hypothetical protein